MKYGFLIDNRKCIGCHACSTACKSENEVPLGVYRTWVKTVEQGTYPDTQRSFQVTRCNHCENPPCVRICPTEAMYQRADGIVEFDNAQCIGCKACIQACPYDAIHIDLESGTAAKCHYCAHRTDLGLEPACVVVCPEHAIVAGDLDDPRSEISQLASRQPVSVRKPEQGTRPKLFYIDGEAHNLDPLATRRPVQMMFADAVAEDLAREPLVPLTGSPSHGPIEFSSHTMAGEMAQVAYNAQHKVPWHWPVPAYLVTKGIASGVLMLSALALALDIRLRTPLASALGFVALAALALTTALLVFDLERPERFLKILLRPNPRSWLARGAVLLIGSSLVATAWWGAEVADAFGWLSHRGALGVRPWLLGLGAPLALGTAVYTAFLFGQAEGRDLWQSPLLPFHLALQAVWAGAATILLMGLFWTLPAEFFALARWSLGLGLLLDGFVLLFGELGMRHASQVAATAAHAITHGRYRKLFWGGAIGLGHVLALLLLLPSSGFTAALAGLAALIGLYCYEYAFVMAPQDVPNS